MSLDPYSCSSVSIILNQFKPGCPHPLAYRLTTRTPEHDRSNASVFFPRSPKLPVPGGTAPKQCRSLDDWNRVLGDMSVYLRSPQESCWYMYILLQMPARILHLIGFPVLMVLRRLGIALYFLPGGCKLMWLAIISRCLTCCHIIFSCAEPKSIDSACCQCHTPGSTLAAALCGERAVGEPQAGKGRHTLAPKAPE